MTESLGKWGFPCGSAGRVSFFSAGDLGSIPGLEKSPGEGKLENSMDCIVHGIAESDTTRRLSLSLGKYLPKWNVGTTVPLTPIWKTWVYSDGHSLVPTSARNSRAPGLRQASGCGGHLGKNVCFLRLFQGRLGGLALRFTMASLLRKAN